jgi:hypothetical protein
MPGKIGVLDTLSEEQQEQLLTWLSILPDREVLDRVTASPPEGFGIKTHITSIRRFEQRKQMEACGHDLSLAREAKLPEVDRATMLNAASDALVQKAFQLAANPKANGFALAALTQSLVSLQRQKLREKQLDLAERRLELERKKLEAALALKEAQSPTEYQEQKIRATRETLFKV